MKLRPRALHADCRLAGLEFGDARFDPGEILAELRELGLVQLHGVRARVVLHDEAHTFPPLAGMRGVGRDDCGDRDARVLTLERADDLVEIEDDGRSGD